MGPFFFSYNMLSLTAYCFTSHTPFFPSRHKGSPRQCLLLVEEMIMQFLVFSSYNRCRVNGGLFGVFICDRSYQLRLAQTSKSFWIPSGNLIHVKKTVFCVSEKAKRNPAKERSSLTGVALKTDHLFSYSSLQYAASCNPGYFFIMDYFSYFEL